MVNISYSLTHSIKVFSFSSMPETMGLTFMSSRFVIRTYLNVSIKSGVIVLLDDVY